MEGLIFQSIPVFFKAPLWGTILGDAHVSKFVPTIGTKGGKGKNSRMTFEYSDKNNALAKTLHKILSDAGIKCGKLKMRVRVDKRTGSVNRSWVFKAGASPYFTTLRNIFYIESIPHAIKIVPQDIASVFTAWDLAWWIMDDGNWTGYGVILNTHSFSIPCLNILIAMLQDNFGISAGIKKTSKSNQFILYIPAREIPKLREIVIPFMVPQFLYKIGL